MKKTIYVLVLGAAFGLLGFAAMPAAQAVERTEAFVCPVLNATVGAHNPNTFNIADGDFSLFPSGEMRIINVPDGATNGNGAGAPSGSHSSPGDNDYTAIWAI
ncbi:hypothetical protein IID19_00610 [Patescibacteria group bacterium]|nr:hypothetical protein [Patescibacteria group bacterium]